MDVDGALAVGRLIAELGGVEGRKRLQKIVHLLRAKGHEEFKQRFILHYFGPFSRQLATQLDFLSAAELIIEVPEENGAFSYSVPEGARADLSDLRSGSAEPPPWAEFAQELDNASTEELESVSTLVFLHLRGTKGNVLEAEFARVKPHLTARFSDARQFADEHALLQQT